MLELGVEIVSNSVLMICSLFVGRVRRVEGRNEMKWENSRTGRKIIRCRCPLKKSWCPPRANNLATGLALPDLLAGFKEILLLRKRREEGGEERVTETGSGGESRKGKGGEGYKGRRGKEKREMMGEEERGEEGKSVHLTCAWWRDKQVVKQFWRQTASQWRIFHAEKLTQHSCLCRYWFSFVAAYAAVTYNVFQWTGQLPKTAPSRGGSGPHKIQRNKIIEVRLVLSQSFKKMLTILYHSNNYSVYSVFAITRDVEGK